MGSEMMTTTTRRFGLALVAALAVTGAGIPAAAAPGETPPPGAASVGRFAIVQNKVTSRKPGALQDQPALVGGAIVERGQLSTTFGDLAELVAQPSAPGATTQPSQALTQGDDDGRGQGFPCPGGNFPGQPVGLGILHAEGHWIPPV